MVLNKKHYKKLSLSPDVTFSNFRDKPIPGKSAFELIDKTIDYICDKNNCVIKFCCTKWCEEFKENLYERVRRY